MGDTLWLESEYAFSLTDLNSNTMVEVDSFEMLIELLTGTLDSLGEDASDYFDFFVEKGTLNSFDFSGGMSRQLLYDSSGGKNRIKIGIVAKESGSFYFELFSWFHRNSNLSEEYFSRKVDFSNGNCTEYLYLTFQTESTTIENNYHLLQESPVEFFQQYDFENFIESGTFVVKVRE